MMQRRNHLIGDDWEQLRSCTGELMMDMFEVGTRPKSICDKRGLKNGRCLNHQRSTGK